MGPLYLQAMDAIYSVSPNTLFLVEGCGQTSFPGINWGDGFVTDKSLISQYGLSDANLFFGPLLSKPYLNKVGISPHVYPPSVSYATTVRLACLHEGRVHCCCLGTGNPLASQLDKLLADTQAFRRCCSRLAGRAAASS